MWVESWDLCEADLTQKSDVLRFGGGWCEEEKETPCDLIASRLWEAALIFDNMKGGKDLFYKESRKAGIETRHGFHRPCGTNRFGHGFPGTLCLANFRCRSATPLFECGGSGNRQTVSGWPNRLLPFGTGY